MSNAARNQIILLLDRELPDLTGTRRDSLAAQILAVVEAYGKKKRGKR